MSVEKKVLQIYAASMQVDEGQSWIRAVAVEKVGQYMRELITFLDGRHPEIARSIADKKALDDGIKKSLDAALKEFSGIFQA